VRISAGVLVLFEFLRTKENFMSKQETFDKVVNGLRAQGCQSMGNYISTITGAMVEGCCYRGENNTKCAAGQLIPDEEYSIAMEGKLCSDELVAPVLTAGGHNIDLCRRLQEIHDCYDVEDWEEKFKFLANREALVYTPPTEKL
jgi:hypothetical protein